MRKQTFRLHPGLNPDDYQITNSLRDVDRWRCRVYVGDGRDTGEDHVGYVMISLKDDTIVPIARGDEHHRGMDLMYDFQNGHRSKYYRVDKINGLIASDYIPIFALGNNYIYDPKDAPLLLIVLRKYLAYGGVDNLLKGAYQMDGKMVRVSTFVAKNGNMEVEKGKLAPLGQKIYDDLSALAKAIRDLPPEADRIAAKSAFIKAVALLKDIKPEITYDLGLDYDEFKQLPNTLRQLQKENDLRGLEELFFDFHGIKNKIHKYIKENRDHSWRERDIRAIWGDVDLAIDMLGRI